MPSTSPSKPPRPPGAFEKEILSVLTRLRRDAYGITIAKEIAVATNRKPNLGLLYATLDRLVEKGFAKAEWGEPTAVRGGRRKRLYTLTAAGQAALDASRHVLEGRAAWSPINPLEA